MIRTLNISKRSSRDGDRISSTSEKIWRPCVLVRAPQSRFQEMAVTIKEICIIDKNNVKNIINMVLR